MSMTDGPTPLRTAAAEQAAEDREASSKAPGRSALRQQGKRKPGFFSDRWQALSRQQQWAFLIVVVVLAYLLPLINPPIITTEPGNNFALACFDMARFALIAVGLNIVVGYAGLLDLGYVAFFAVGSYVAAMLTSPDSPYLHIPYLWTLPVAMAVTMFFGVMLGVPTLRLRGDYLAIVTLGFGEIIRILAT
ncbi:MAG: ABC transporter permease subunit, partial [Arthrobacter sp.]